ncbi:MAG: Arc family DNA-binding protein [Rhodospirillales bacterium]|jgi:plasmid stability protein|nr:Arc family DNA-binding protein [Rhodospirillales bacterium]
MAKALNVRNLDDGVYEKLRSRAARHGRSTEAEIRQILTDTIANEPRQDFWALAEKLRAATKGRRHTPSEILQREGRDER